VCIFTQIDGEPFWREKALETRLPNGPRQIRHPEPARRCIADLEQSDVGCEHSLAFEEIRGKARQVIGEADGIRGVGREQAPASSIRSGSTSVKPPTIRRGCNRYSEPFDRSDRQVFVAQLGVLEDFPGGAAEGDLAGVQNDRIV
jgi:hypothetical protein